MFSNLGSCCDCDEPTAIKCCFCEQYICGTHRVWTLVPSESVFFRPAITCSPCRSKYRHALGRVILGLFVGLWGVVIFSLTASLGVLAITTLLLVLLFSGIVSLLFVTIGFGERDATGVLRPPIWFRYMLSKSVWIVVSTLIAIFFGCLWDLVVVV